MKKVTSLIAASFALSASFGSLAADTTSASSDVVCKKARASIYQDYRKKCMSETEWKTWTAKAEKQLKRQASFAQVSPSQTKAILEEDASKATAKVARHSHPSRSHASDRLSENRRALAKVQ